MSDWTIQLGADGTAVDLPAGIETNLMGAQSPASLDIAQGDVIVIEIENDNGSSPIDVTTVYEMTPGGTKWIKRTDLTMGSIAASAAGQLTITTHAHGRMKITCTPVAHVSADFHFRILRKNL